MISFDELSQFFTRLLIKEVMKRHSANAEVRRQLEEVLRQEEIYPDHLENLFDEEEFYQLEER